MLNREERTRMEQRLLDERGRTLEALAEFDEGAARSLLDRSGDLSLYRLHPADLGTESMEREKEFLLASREGARLYQIDDALRRLYDDPESFGRCRRCGVEISRERMELVPESEFCADCQEASER